MRRRTFAVLVLLASFWIVSSASAGIDEEYRKPADKKTWGELLLDFVGHPGVGKSYALVVGISQYDNYPSLPTANDPLRMRDFLLNEAGFDYVHVLTDDKATKARIEELMVDVLPGMIHDNDRFLFYWSGHGTQRPNDFGGQVGYLPLASSPIGKYATMISMGDIQRWDEVIHAKQALFLLDSCLSGLAGSAGKSEPQELQIDQLDKPAHDLVSAGTAEEETIAGDRWGGSIFTDAILRGMRGEADAATSYPKDGVVSLSELIGYVKTRVAFEAPAAGWTKSITPQPYNLRSNTGEFFFLTDDRKLAKLESVGAQYQGHFENGMPVVTKSVAPLPTCDHDADREFWDSIKTETAPGYFEAYLKRVENGELCGLFADVARLKARALVVAPPPVIKTAAEPNPGAVEAALNLHAEDRIAIQKALTALNFDPRGTDGVFGVNTRTAIAGWQRARGEQPSSYLTPSQYSNLLAEAQPKLAALEGARQTPPAAPPKAEVPPRTPRDCQPSELDRRREQAGGQTGQVTVSLGWDGTADLDLAVVCPDGGTIWFNQRNACGGRLDVDMNASGKHSPTPIENVFWPSKPGKGTYQVYVSLFDRRGDRRRSIPFQVELDVLGDRQQVSGMAERARQPVLVKEFEITDAQLPAAPACPPVVVQVPPPPAPASSPKPDPIPQGAWKKHDISFLKGCWNLDSQYQTRDAQTGQIRQVKTWEVCFDGAGHGQQTLAFDDGKSCKGPMLGSFDDQDQLLLQDTGNLPCEGSFYIYERHITCARVDPEHAKCNSFQSETGGRADVTFRHRAEADR